MGRIPLSIIKYPFILLFFFSTILQASPTPHKNILPTPPSLSTQSITPEIHSNENNPMLIQYKSYMGNVTKLRIQYEEKIHSMKQAFMQNIFQMRMNFLKETSVLQEKMEGLDRQSRLKLQEKIKARQLALKENIKNKKEQFFQVELKAEIDAYKKAVEITRNGLKEKINSFKDAQAIKNNKNSIKAEL